MLETDAEVAMAEGWNRVDRPPCVTLFYAARKAMFEPVFGHIKEARGFRRFLLRGHAKVPPESSLALYDAQHLSSCTAFASDSGRPIRSCAGPRTPLTWTTGPTMIAGAPALRHQRTGTGRYRARTCSDAARRVSRTRA